MINLKKLITEARLKSITVMNDKMLQKFVVVAQQQYDAWIQNAEGYDEEMGVGGICHLIAEDLAGILSEAGIEAASVSSTFEQHVYVVAKFREGIYEIDIPYHTYETGGGFTWKKIPNVTFDSSHVSIHKLDSNPKNFNQYLDLMENKGVLREIEGYDPLTELMGRIKRLEISLKIAFPQLADLSLFLKSEGEELHLNSLRVKPNYRRMGVGAKVMKKICDFADIYDLYVTLKPVPEKGYKERLNQFYKQFGFYPNKGRKGLSQYGGAFGIYWIRRPKKIKKEDKPEEPLTEIESPYEPAKDTDIKRGYIGAVYNHQVYAYDQIVPNVMQVDHSELPYGRSGTQWRYFIERPWNTILWNEFPPTPEDRDKVVEWLEKKGIQNPRDIHLMDYNYIYNRK